VLRVLALLPYPLRRAPGQRYRIEQWAPALAAEGVAVAFRPFLAPWGMDVLYQRGRTLTKTLAVLAGCLRRLRDATAVPSHDIVYVYREAMLLGPSWLEAACAWRRPLVFDFDDAIYLRDASAANPWARRLRPESKTASLCRLATHVTVGNEQLARYARPLARRVTVVPSTVDTMEYQVLARPQNPKPLLGWTGSSTTVRYLASLHPALLALRGLVDYRLRIIGATPDLPGIDVEHVPWRPETEADDLRAVDVGLMPLPDDDWSRGKSGMKALQYMALGIAPVVSPVGVNADIVEDGRNGLHASSQEDWITAMARLLRDAELRCRLGVEARRTVEAKYSARVQAPRFARVLRDAFESHGSARGTPAR
jgi:glycosyltransferase involved in cell wall biosynthesis